MMDYFENKSPVETTGYLKTQHLNISHSLDAASYFHSFVKECYRLSLISPEQLESLQYQLLELLSTQLHRYTSGQSSSVQVETGQRIQQSVFYTLGYFLKNLSDVETELQAFKENSLSDLYHDGKKLIEVHWKDAKSLLQAVQENCLVTDVFAYNDTLIKGLPMFFNSYDIDYGAHESPGSIDYPLSNDTMNLTGIDYLFEYLKKLQLENEFCNYFSNEEAVQDILRGYDANYQDLLFNIYDLMLTNTIGNFLLDRKELSLHMTEYDRQYLLHSFESFSKEMTDELIDNATSSLCLKLSISNTPLGKYIKKSTINLKTRLKHALEIDGLKYLFLSAVEDTTSQLIQFEDKGKLDNDNFRILAEEIRECRLVSDKLVLIQREQLAMEDLVDLLEGDCFFGAEYLAVFQTMEDIRLALLLKQIPLVPVDSGFLLEENSPEWHNSFIAFLDQIPPKKKEALLTLEKRLQIYPIQD